MTIWDILHALSGLDDYVGQCNDKRELVIKPKSELKPTDIVAGMSAVECLNRHRESQGLQ